MTRKSRIAGAMLAPTFALALMAVFGAVNSAANDCDSCTSEATSIVTTCGTQMPSDSELLAIEIASAEVESAPVPLVTIPVYFHIITTDLGEGDFTDAAIGQQVAIMNTAFAGGQGTGAANTNYRFTLAGITRTANTAWYTAGINTPDEAAMKTALRVGSADDLNIYMKLSDVGGYSTFSWQYAGNPLMDGIVGTLIPGDGMVHEVGHWLGLFHTFQGGCDVNNDFVTDTPAQRDPNRACPLPRNLDTCGGKSFSGKDPTNNFMDYTPDACRDRFTAGQSARMDIMYNAHRAGK